MCSMEVLKQYRGKNIQLKKQIDKLKEERYVLLAQLGKKTKVIKAQEDDIEELKRQLREQNEEMKLLHEEFGKEILEYEQRQEELDEKEVDLFYREEKLERKESELRGMLQYVETLLGKIKTSASVTKLKNDVRQLRL